MKGQILSYNTETQTGVISAENGKRYDFSVADFKSDQSSIQRGAQIEFTLDNAGAAKDIYLLDMAPQNNMVDIPGEQLADFSEENHVDEMTESFMEKMKNTVKNNKKSSAIVLSIVLAIVFYKQLYVPHVTPEEASSFQQNKKSYCVDTPVKDAKYRLPDDMAEFMDSGIIHARYKNGKIDTGVSEGIDDSVPFSINDLYKLDDSLRSAIFYTMYKDGEAISSISYSPTSEFPFIRIDYNTNINSYDVIDHKEVPFKKVTFFDGKGKIKKVIDYNGNNGESKTLYPNKRVKMIEYYTGYEQYPNKRATFYDTGAKRCEYDFTSETVSCYYPNGNLNSEYKPGGNKGYSGYTGYFPTGEKKYFVDFNGYFAHKISGILEWDKMQAVSHPEYVVNENKYKIIPCDQQLATGEAVVYDLPSGTPGTRSVGNKICVDDDMGRWENFVEWDINGNIVKKVGNTPEELEENRRKMDEMMMRRNLGWSN